MGRVCDNLLLINMCCFPSLLKLMSMIVRRTYQIDSSFLCVSFLISLRPPQRWRCLQITGRGKLLVWLVFCFICFLKSFCLFVFLCLFVCLFVVYLSVFVVFFVYFLAAFPIMTRDTTIASSLTRLTSQPHQS
jgi:hypothetical protein